MEGMVMTELKKEWLTTAIKALKGASPEQQEATILELEKDHPGIGEKARALMAQEAATDLWIETGEPRPASPTARPTVRRPVAAAPKPKPTPQPQPQPQPQPKPTPEEEPRKAAVLDKGPTIRWPKEWPEPPLPPPSAQGFERLLYPPGLLGHAVQFVMDTAGLPDRKLALAVALSACAKGIDRKVIGPSGNSTILFTLVIAETGAGKQHGFDCIRVLLRAMGIEQCYAAGGLASVQSIEETIEGIKDRTEPNPNALVA